MLFNYFYDKIKATNESNFDSSYLNFSKFLVNANVDNLMKLEKYNKNKTDLENFKKEFLTEKNRKKGKIIKEILNEKENKEVFNESNEEMDLENNQDSDNDIFIENLNKNKIPKIDFDSADDSENNESGYSDWGESLDESYDDSEGGYSSDGMKKEKKKSNQKSFDINFQVSLF